MKWNENGGKDELKRFLEAEMTVFTEEENKGKIYFSFE